MESALKVSANMRKTIARLERRFGKLNKYFYVEPYKPNRVGRGFYDGCTLTCDTLKSLHIEVAHDGTWN